MDKRAACPAHHGAAYPWLSATFAPTSTRREPPFLVTDPNGSVVSGVIGLLVETDAGYWVLDHKSDETDDPAGRWAAYRPQLQAFTEVVLPARPETPVLGVGVNRLARGEVSCVIVLPDLSNPQGNHVQSR